MPCVFVTITALGPSRAASSRSVATSPEPGCSTPDTRFMKAITSYGRCGSWYSTCTDSFDTGGYLCSETTSVLVHPPPSRTAAIDNVMNRGKAFMGGMMPESANLVQQSFIASKFARLKAAGSATKVRASDLTGLAILQNRALPITPKRALSSDVERFSFRTPSRNGNGRVDMALSASSVGQKLRYKGASKCQNISFRDPIRAKV
jgi:hypothetical protein